MGSNTLSHPPQRKAISLLSLSVHMILTLGPNMCSIESHGGLLALVFVSLVEDDDGVEGDSLPVI